MVEDYERFGWTVLCENYVCLFFPIWNVIQLLHNGIGIQLYICLKYELVPLLLLLTAIAPLTSAPEVCVFVWPITKHLVNLNPPPAYFVLRIFQGEVPPSLLMQWALLLTMTFFTSTHSKQPQPVQY